MPVIIVLTSGLGLLTPLMMRDLIDRTLPNRNLNHLGLLALGLLNAVGLRWCMAAAAIWSFKAYSPSARASPSVPTCATCIVCCLMSRFEAQVGLVILWYNTVLQSEM